MTDDEIFYALEGRVVGGKVEEQDEARELIAMFLASVEDNQKLVGIDWNVTIPSKNSSAKQFHFPPLSSEQLEVGRKPWFIILSKEGMGKDEFVQTFMHELAHVYYEDDGIIPPEIKEPQHWQPIIEVRADLQVEKWGALKSEFKADTYTHCDKKQWEMYFSNSMSQEEAKEFAKIGTTDQIITQYKNKYPIK